jgi:hypothetical protein
MTAAKEAYVGIDVVKLRSAVAIVDAGREGRSGVSERSYLARAA